MRLAGHRSGAPEERRGGLPSQAIALVGPLLVVKAQEGLQGLLQGRPTGEIPAPELDAPVLLQDRALEPFDEAVSPGMARLGARVPNAQGTTGLIKGPFEFRAAIGEDPAQRPAGAPIERHENLAQERRGGRGREGGEQPGYPVGARRIAGRDLPDLADAFEFPNVKGVQTDELAGHLRRGGSAPDAPA